MTIAPAAFKAAYSDLKFVKSRKCAQIVLELPIEESSRFVAAFGTPDPSKETWVAIARLVPEKLAGEPGKPAKRHLRDMQPSQQAALRCNEPAFRSFLEERFGEPLLAEECADYVRKFCGVGSRSELDRDAGAAARWKALDDDYFGWQRGIS